MTTDMFLGLAALVLISGSGILWFRAAMAVRLPRNRSFYISVWVVGVVLAGLALTGSPGWLGGPAAFIALLGGGLLLLTVVISPQKVADTAIRPGDPLPEFSAVDEHGAPFESSSLTGQRLLLKFFRGHW